jgi:hypothetical protein
MLLPVRKRYERLRGVQQVPPQRAGLADELAMIADFRGPNWNDT